MYQDKQTLALSISSKNLSQLMILPLSPAVSAHTHALSSFVP